jgi:hypothetical protein
MINTFCRLYVCFNPQISWIILYIYLFFFLYMLIFHSWYVSLLLLYVVNTCFIEGQHIIIDYFILFIFSFLAFISPISFSISTR